MSLFGGLFKKKQQEQAADLSKKFGENVIDEIERLNREFKYQAQPSEPQAPQPIPSAPAEPPMMDEPPASAPEVENEVLAEPPEVEEEMPKKATTSKKPLKPASAVMKGAAKSPAVSDFSQKIEKLKKKIETSNEMKSLQGETAKKLEDLKGDFNKKVNALIDQVREVNSAFKKYEAQEQALLATQHKIEEVQAHVDDLQLRLKDMEKIEVLRKDLVGLKNTVKGIKNYDADIAALRAQSEDNAAKLKQLLSLVEMLLER